MVSPQKWTREFVAARRRFAAASRSDDISDFVVPPPFSGESQRESSQHLSSIDIVKRRRLSGRPNVSRCLFPKIAGVKDDTDSWLAELETKHLTEASTKWQFDFANGRPLTTANEDSAEEAHCQWDAVSLNEVPRFYGEYQVQDSEMPSTSDDHTVIAQSDFAQSLRAITAARRRRSPEKRRASPRKSTAAGATLTRLAANTLLPPSAATLLSAPRKASSPARDVSVSPRKSARVESSSRSTITTASNGHSSNRQLIFAVEPVATARHVFNPHSHYHHSTNGGQTLDEEDVMVSPLARNSGASASKSSKEQHKTPHKAARR